MCERQRSLPNYGRTPRGNMWQSHWWPCFRHKDHPCRILLAHAATRLSELRPEMRPMLETLRLAPSPSRRIIFNKLPMAFPYLGDRHTRVVSPSARQVKFLIVAIEYFTKWIEVEAVTTITAARVKNFVWKQIVCRFGTPKRLISDNGTKFTGSILREACVEWEFVKPSP